MERRRTHVPNIVPQQSAWLIRHEVLNPTLVQAPVSTSRRPRLTATSVVRVGRIAVPAAEVMEAHRPLAGNAPKPVAYNALDVGHTGSRQGAVLVKTAVYSRRGQKQRCEYVLDSDGEY